MQRTRAPRDATLQDQSCKLCVPQIFISPDNAMHAVVLPVDVSLYATPDMESRVVIRSSDGNTLTSEDHSSPRGEQGYYVYATKWSPNSEFFVYSLTSAAGHRPGRFRSWCTAASRTRSPGSAT